LREALFIKRNAEKWKKFQHEVPQSVDETADRFMVLIDDLSYARTFYPRSKVTTWINGITASIYQNIYRNKKEKYSRIFSFWKYELPYLFYRHQKVFLFAAIFFLIAVSIGFFANNRNPDFIRSILGDDYVNMTENNIASGDPFGVYKDQNPFIMFVLIAFNNIKVAFTAFLGGLTVGLFTMYILWFNGVMLGAFHEMFFANGLGMSSILVIWIHGTLEIFSIVIAGTAGLVLAKGILFPGTYSRLLSFKRAARDGMRIMICLIPFFITAAFLESYITHLMSETFSTNNDSGMPVWVSVLILFSCLSLIVWYFIIWPIKLHRRGIIQPDQRLLDRLKVSNV